MVMGHKNTIFINDWGKSAAMLRFISSKVSPPHDLTSVVETDKVIRLFGCPGNEKKILINCGSGRRIAVKFVIRVGSEIKFFLPDNFTGLRIQTEDKLSGFTGGCTSGKNFLSPNHRG